ncbi:hypothetical protein TNCV_1297471 [Trichonephila clavipes]|nr:hypothetical protein TNCV_1297471 [Trichonephila clavipes]
MAVRNNTDDLESIKTTAWTVYFPLFSTNKSPQHELCPASTNSWCKFQKAEAEFNEKCYNHKKHTHVPFSIINEIKSIFRDLVDPMILKNVYIEIIKTPKKSPERLHTWKNDRETGGGAYRHQCSCIVQNQQKCRFVPLESVPKPQVHLLKRMVVAARGRQLQGTTDISSCRRKEADGSQQASLLSNSLQQRGDKCRGLLWPDAFTKGAYSLAVLNAASR